MRVIILALALISFSMGAMAQNKVTGNIVDAKTDKGIPFVNVGVFRQADSVFVSGAASDDKGVFELQNVPNGNYNLKVSAIGYQIYEQVLEVKGNLNLGQVKLSEGATTLNEVVITEKRPLFAVEGEKTMYNTAEDPSIQTGTASDALQNAPGVTVDVEGNITLRGTSNVEVWINDKPSHMSAENLKTYIQQMPANSIDHIEVITNPSARYGSKADGIINIVTNAKIKKNHFVSFGANASTRPNVSPWVSYVWSNEKLSINAYVNAGFMKHKSSGFTDQSLFTENHVLANHEVDSSRNSQNQISGGWYFSLDYEIDTANSLNFWMNGSPASVNQTSENKLLREEYLDAEGHPLPSMALYDYKYMSSGGGKYLWAMAGLYYEHKFKGEGHNLSVSADGMGFGINGFNHLEKDYTLPIPYRKVIDGKSRNMNIGGELEVIYNRPYSEKGEISLGLNSSYSPESAMVEYDSVVDGNLVHDTWRSYDVKYFDLSNEVFFTLQHKFGNFTLKPGIRFCSNLVSFPDSLNTANELRHFFTLRPSLHLSYRTESMHNFSASYTRRISNPDAEILTAFVRYDEDSFTCGNPALKSVYTNAVELGWTKYWMKFGSVGVSAYYRDHNNEVSDIPLSMYHPLYGRVVNYSYPVNVGFSSTTGANVNVMFRPNGFFNVRLNAGLYNDFYKTDFEGQRYSDHLLTYNFSLYAWAKLWNKLEVTLSGYYRSPSRASIFSNMHAFYAVNCGLKADFFDRMMTVFVNAQDIFNWGRWGESNYSPYVVSNSSTKVNSRFISVGLSFRFGKMELEQKAKQGASESNVMQGQGGM